MKEGIQKSTRELEAGISSHAYAWATGIHGTHPVKAMTVFDLIDKAVLFGLKYVQIADNLPLEEFSEDELRELKTYAKQHGVQIQVGANRLTIERLELYLEICVFLETDILRFVIDGEGYAPSIEDVVKVAKASLPALERNRIYLALENHDRLLANEFVEIVEKVSSEWVAICLDTVNSVGAGEGIETVAKYLGPLTVNFHVKEFIAKRLSHKMGFLIEGRPLGEGQLPVAEVIECLGPNCNTAILEQWTPPIAGDLEATILMEDQWATQSIEYLKRIVDNHSND